MAHGDAREGEWRGNWRMEWVASALYTTSEHGVCSITTADAHTSAASSRLNWRPADLSGLVRFAERRNLVSARVPSHFKRRLPSSDGSSCCSSPWCPKGVGTSKLPYVMGVERLQSETDIPSSPKNYKAWNFTYCTCLLGVAFTFLLNFNCFCPNSSVFFGLDCR